MNLLAVDTSHAYCSVCVLIARGGRCDAVHSERRRTGRGHAEILFEIIETTLEKSGLSRRDIDRIAVNVGPGSFTGLRVGIAAARGLALALECACVGVTTLEALAWNCPAGPEEILILVEAGRGDVVCQRFDGATRTALSPAVTLPAAEAAARFADFRGIVTGSGIAHCFPGAEPPAGFSVIAQDWPDIETIARLGARKPTGTRPKPFYSRAADAKPQISANLVTR